jgi:hypothetical protein
VSLSPTVMLTNVINVNDHEAVFTLAKLRAITPTTETSDSHHCTCLGHLGQCDTDRIVSIYYRAAQGGHGKYYSDCRMLLPRWSRQVLVTVTC